MELSVPKYKIRSCNPAFRKLVVSCCELLNSDEALYQVAADSRARRTLSNDIHVGGD